MTDRPSHGVISFILSVADIISAVAIEEMVEACGIEPGRLCFEVAETAMLTTSRWPDPGWTG